MKKTIKFFNRIAINMNYLFNLKVHKYITTKITIMFKTQFTNLKSLLQCERWAKQV